MSQVTNVLSGAETLPKISIGWVRCTNVTDRRQTTDGRRQTDGRRHIGNINMSSRSLKIGDFSPTWSVRPKISSSLANPNAYSPFRPFVADLRNGGPLEWRAYHILSTNINTKTNILMLQFSMIFYATFLVNVTELTVTHGVDRF